MCVFFFYVLLFFWRPKKNGLWIYLFFSLTFYNRLGHNSYKDQNCRSNNAMIGMMMTHLSDTYHRTNYPSHKEFARLTHVCDKRRYTFQWLERQQVFLFFSFGAAFTAGCATVIRFNLPYNSKR